MYYNRQERINSTHVQIVNKIKNMAIKKLNQSFKCFIERKYSGIPRIQFAPAHDIFVK